MSHDNEASPDFTGIVDGPAPAEDFQVPDPDKELLKRVHALFESAEEHRSEYERNWDLYRRYLKGDQLIVHKTTGELVRLSPEDSKRLRSVKNVLRPVARSLVGKLCRSIPLVRCVPPSADFEDAHAAQVADALLLYLRRKLELELKYQEAIEYLPWAGNGFLELEWDRLAGETKAWCKVCDFLGDREDIGAVCPQCQMQREQEIQVQQDARQLLAMDAAAQAAASQEIDPYTGEATITLPSVPEPEMEQLGPLPLGQEPPALEEIKTGDMTVSVLDARDVYVEPGARTLAEARYVFIRRVVPLSKVRRDFPEMAKFIKADTLIDERVRAEMLGGFDEGLSERSFEDHVLLYKVHEGPSEQFPEGRIIWATQDMVLREIKSPYYDDFERHPVYHFGWDRNCGEFYCEPFIAQAWHRQKEINNVQTAKREHIELLLKPKFLNPLGSRIRADELTATTAQVISYNASAGVPAFLPPPPVPPDLWNRDAELDADVRQSAGVTDSDVGLSQSDPNGRALAIINAEADQQLGPITKRNNSEFRALHRGMLLLARKFYSPERTWTLAGEDGVEVYHFYDMASMIDIDVELEEHDGMSVNPTLRLQQSIDLASLGYFMDATTGLLDKKAFARAAKLHVSDSGYSMEATERASAAAIPCKIQRGEQILPHTFDDPQVFAEELLAWLRGPGRREDPALVQQVEMIWQFYVEWALTGMMPGNGMPALSSRSPTYLQAGPGMAGPGAGPGGPDQTAPGGSANNPGHMGSDRPVTAMAQQSVGAADSRAEGAAQVQSSREG